MTALRSLMALSAFCLVANQFDARADHPATRPTDHPVTTQPTERRVGRTALAARSGGLLRFDLQSGGSIRVVGWDRDSVAVMSDADGDCPAVETTADGDGVRVRTAGRRNRNSDCDLRLVINVPARYDVEIDSKGGGVTISGVTGRFSGRTMGGALNLDRLAGTLDLSTMGGSVSLTNADIDGKLSTMGGSVRLAHIVGDVNATTLGGSVSRTDVTSRRGERQDAVRSSSGETRSTSPSGVVEIHKMGGGIELTDAPAGADLSTMGGAIYIGRSGGRVKVSTMGGNIRLDAIDGAIQATTMGGNIVATMIGDPATGERSVDLGSLHGDVTLTLPAGLSVDLEARLTTTNEADRTYRIVSDIPLPQRVEPDRRDRSRQTVVATGSVGGGRQQVRLRTINGNLTIRFAR